MSRVGLLEKMYTHRKSIFDFDYDALRAPRILELLTLTDVGDLHSIATSLKYSANINKKYKLIDQIMKRRGFKKAHAGTNRVVYNFLDLPTIINKIAIDRVGITNNPDDFKNQKFFKPFCNKIFENDLSGTVSMVERVNPITSLEEFLSVSDDIFNLMITKIIGKYVVDDLGSEYYMNYGIRHLANGATFGPVLIDFPEAFELDEKKLICVNNLGTPYKPIYCGGEIDYDSSLSHLYCTKCGKSYTAKDLKKPNCGILFCNEDIDEEVFMPRVKIVDRKTKKIILDNGKSSSIFINLEKQNKKFIDKYNLTEEVVNKSTSEAPRRMNKKQHKQYVMKNLYDKYVKKAEEYDNMYNQNMYDLNLNLTEQTVAEEYVVNSIFDNNPTLITDNNKNDGSINSAIINALNEARENHFVNEVDEEDIAENALEEEVDNNIVSYDFDDSQGVERTDNYIDTDSYSRHKDSEVYEYNEYETDETVSEYSESDAGFDNTSESNTGNENEYSEREESEEFEETDSSESGVNKDEYDEKVEESEEDDSDNNDEYSNMFNDEYDYEYIETPKKEEQEENPLYKKYNDVVNTELEEIEKYAVPEEWIQLDGNSSNNHNNIKYVSTDGKIHISTDNESSEYIDNY